MFFTSTQLYAQSLQLGGLSFTRFPNADITDSPFNQSVETNEYKFFINIPAQLKNDRTILVNGLTYSAVTPFAENDLNNSIDRQNLHLVDYQLILIQRLKKEWTGIVVLNPALSSTFNTWLESDDLIFNVTLQLVKMKSKDFNYGFGVARTARFGESRFLPILQLTKANKNSTLQVFLPRQISYDYHFGNIDVGAQISVEGSEYNANYSVLNFNNFEVPVDKLAYSRITFGPKLSYSLNDLVRIEVLGGLVAKRSIELQGNSLNDENFEIENAPFFQFGLILVPPKK